MACYNYAKNDRIFPARKVTFEYRLDGAPARNTRQYLRQSFSSEQFADERMSNVIIAHVDFLCKNEWNAIVFSNGRVIELVKDLFNDGSYVNRMKIRKGMAGREMYPLFSWGPSKDGYTRPCIVEVYDRKDDEPESFFGISRFVRKKSNDDGDDECEAKGK